MEESFQGEAGGEAADAGQRVLRGEFPAKGRTAIWPMLMSPSMFSESLSTAFLARAVCTAGDWTATTSASSKTRSAARIQNVMRRPFFTIYKDKKIQLDFQSFVIPSEAKESF